jgi:hypothetical protein
MSRMPRTIGNLNRGCGFAGTGVEKTEKKREEKLVLERGRSNPKWWDRCCRHLIV